MCIAITVQLELVSLHMETALLEFFVQNWKDITPTAVQFLGILLGAWIVGRQIASQSELQDSQARDKLYADLYERLSDQIDACQEELLTFQSKISACLSKIKQYWWLKDKGVRSSNPQRSDELSNAQHEVLLSILKVMGTLERYEITFPEHRLMAAARGLMSLQAEELSKTFGEFWDLSHRFLPIDVPADEPLSKIQSILEPPRPTDGDLEKMNNLADRYILECTTALGYLIDLRHVFQNNLLGHLFNRTLAARQPNRSDLLVIKNDADMLSKIESRLKERQDEIRDRVNEWRESQE